MRNARFDDDPARYAARRDAWVQTRRRLEINRFLAPARPGDVVAEVGSGTGGMLLELAREHPDLRFVGVEPLPNYVDYAKEQHARAGLDNVEFRVGEAEHLEACLPEPAQWILTNDVLHHVGDEGRAASSIAGVCDPGARWLAIEPNSWNLWMLAYCTFVPGERNFRPKRFLAGAGGAGWQLLDRRYLFLIPSVMPDPSPRLRRLEQRFEHIVPLAGGVALELALDRP